MKPETLKLTEENINSVVQGMVVGKGFSESSPFDKEWKPTIANTDLIKLNSFYIVKKKRGVRREKKQKKTTKSNSVKNPTKWERAPERGDRGSVAKIYTKTLRNRFKETNEPV